MGEQTYPCSYKFIECYSNTSVNTVRSYTLSNFGLIVSAEDSGCDYPDVREGSGDSVDVSADHGGRDSLAAQRRNTLWSC